MKQRQFLIVIERGETNYGAYAPDLPGCVAIGKTRRACEKSMKEAIAFHIEGMLEDGLPIPTPHASAAYQLHEIPRRGYANERKPENRKAIARKLTRRKTAKSSARASR